MQMCILLYYWAYKMMMMIMLMTHRPLFPWFDCFGNKAVVYKWHFAHCLVLSPGKVILNIRLLASLFFWPIYGKTWRRPQNLFYMPPEEDWATATMIACIEKLVNFENVVDETFKRGDKQTDRHACRNTPLLCRRGIHRVKRRHVIYGHDTIAILWL